MAEIDILSINNKKIQDVEARKDIQVIKENQINLIEDDTSMNGISDTNHDNLETTDKTIIGAINEVSSQFKDIVTKTIIEDDKLYLVKSDGTKLDEGTILPVSSTSSNIETYKCEEIGELFDQPGDNKYLGWPAGNLKYDKNIDKFVCLILSCSAHIHSTSELYVSYINKNNYVSEIPVRCLFFDTDKTTSLTIVDEGVCSFIILQNGNYCLFKKIDNKTYRFISEDYGKTWYKEQETNLNVEFWNLFKTSNGRMLATRDSYNSEIYYSDDEGITWQSSTPSGTIGNYQCEGYILELSPNNLMCLARKNIEGMGRTATGSGDCDHALITYSTDNGTTWSAFSESNTIDNMNASSCCGVVHNGVVEIFTCSRWSHEGDAFTTDYANTGKCGAVIHYTATIENALNDNFSKIGIITYSKGTGTNAFIDFHCPCIATNEKDMLLTYYDRTAPYTMESTNYYFIRGNLEQLKYKNFNKKDNSSIYGYSADYINNIINSLELSLKEKTNTLQYLMSKIPNSGIKPPDEITWTMEMNASTATVSFSNTTNTNEMYQYTAYKRNYGTYPYTDSMLNSQKINFIGVDNEEKTCQCYNNVCLIPISKNNFAISTKFRGGKISENLTTSSWDKVGIGLIINGIFYGFYAIQGSNITSLYSTNEYHEYKVIYENNEIKVYFDNNKVDGINVAVSKLDGYQTIMDKLNVTSLDDSNTYALISTFATNYSSVQYMRFGEW